MGVQEKIHAAQTIALSIERHVDSINKRAQSLQGKVGVIKKAAGGTRSGDLAANQMGNAASVLTSAAKELGQSAADLKAYANKLANS